MKKHTHQQIKDVLHYDPETGNFTWLVSLTNRVCIGSRAGFMNDSGYLMIGIDTTQYRAHRLAWFYMTGEWPAKQVDHRNLVRTDNRWGNLREATEQQNAFNHSVRSDNSTGVTGVSMWRNEGREYIIARVSAAGKVVQKNFNIKKLGYEEAFNRACECVKRLRGEMHGEFAQH